MVASPDKQLPGLLTRDLVCLGALSMILTERWAGGIRPLRKSLVHETLQNRTVQPPSASEAVIFAECVSSVFLGGRGTNNLGWNSEPLSFVATSASPEVRDGFPPGPSFRTPLLPVPQVAGRLCIGLYEQS